MDADHESGMEDRTGGPTYKGLFLLTCALLGSSGGWWITNFVADTNALRARVAALEIRDAETKWTFRINEDKLNTHEDRLRALERDQPGKRNGKE